jgi:membrane protein
VQGLAFDRIGIFLRKLRTFGISFSAHLWRSDITGAASSMAFSFFLSLVPLLLIFGFVLGHFLRSQGVNSLIAPLLPGIPKEVQPLLMRELMELSDTRALPAPFLALGFLWVSSSGVHGLFSGVESIFEVPGRPFWKKRVWALLTIVFALVLLPMIGFALLRVGDAVSKDVFRIVLVFSALALGTSSLAWLYRAISGMHGVHTVWPGAFACIATWLLVTWAFGRYVRQLGNYSVYYGGLAAVAVLLLWCWLSALVVLGGAALNHHLFTQWKRM